MTIPHGTQTVNAGTTAQRRGIIQTIQKNGVTTTRKKKKKPHPLSKKENIFSSGLCASGGVEGG